MTFLGDQICGGTGFSLGYHPKKLQVALPMGKVKGFLLFSLLLCENQGLSPEASSQASPNFLLKRHRMLRLPGNRRALVAPLLTEPSGRQSQVPCWLRVTGA